ncbi:ATP-dependent nuclease [Cryobacterium ruanii]|nr:ATP-binding protein [Cryobacterium ruanii]
MAVDVQDLDDIVAFSTVAHINADSVEVTFVHRGGLVKDVRIHYGEIENGKAVLGDGLDLESMERTVRATIFKSDRVDRTSVVGDYAIALNSATQAAVFITWIAASGGVQVSATGLELSYIGAGPFELGPVLQGDEAIKFLVDTAMVENGDVDDSKKAMNPQGNFFTELSVAGYRGFAEARQLRLAQPKGSHGSGLTVLVGANNSGKSSFLEALQIIARARFQRDLSFPQPRRHHVADAVTVQLTRSDDRKLRVETTRPGSSQATITWLPSDLKHDQFDIQVTPSRRQFSPYFGNSGIADRNWGLLDQEYSRTQLREQFVGRLRTVDRDASARKSFDVLLEEIMGAPLIWTIDEIATGQQFLKLIESDGAWHTSEGLGDGLVSLLFIVDALYDSKPGSLIAIDEPELSLHPQLVRRLGRVLSRYAADRQIVVATHSPLLVDWADVANGATVARVYKHNGVSEIAQASDETLRKVAGLTDSQNPRNPHTVGAVAREAFFLEDGIILTEGQDDVVYLPRVLQDLGLPPTDNIYGWGSGGVGNVPTLAGLFVELGFTKIGAILDDDRQPSTLAAVSKLESMGPKVLVRQIPAPDIRFKSAAGARLEVVGMLDVDDIHVRSDIRDEAKKILQDILNHVSGKTAI